MRNLFIFLLIISTTSPAWPTSPYMENPHSDSNSPVYLIYDNKMYSIPESKLHSFKERIPKTITDDDKTLSTLRPYIHLRGQEIYHKFQKDDLKYLLTEKPQDWDETFKLANALTKKRPRLKHVTEGDLCPTPTTCLKHTPVGLCKALVPLPFNLLKQGAMHPNSGIRHKAVMGLASYDANLPEAIAILKASLADAKKNGYPFGYIHYAIEQAQERDAKKN